MTFRAEGVGALLMADAVTVQPAQNPLKCISPKKKSKTKTSQERNTMIWCQNPLTDNATLGLAVGDESSYRTEGNIYVFLCTCACFWCVCVCLSVFYRIGCSFDNQTTYYLVGIITVTTLCLKKVPNFKLSVTLSNLNQFSKFVHCWKAREICYKTYKRYPPHLTHVVTLPWEIKNSNFLQIFSRYERKCKQVAFLSPLTLLLIQKI